MCVCAFLWVYLFHIFNLWTHFEKVTTKHSTIWQKLCILSKNKKHAVFKWKDEQKNAQISKKKNERFATNNNKGMQHHCTSVNLNKIFPPAAILATTTIQQCRIANTMERCPPVCCLIEEGVHLREIASVEKIELCTTLARPFCYCCSGLR